MQLAGGEALDRVSPDVVCDVNSPCENIIFTVIEWNKDLSRVADELDHRPEAKQHERTSLHHTQVTVVQSAVTLRCILTGTSIRSRNGISPIEWPASGRNWQQHWKNVFLVTTLFWLLLLLWKCSEMADTAVCLSIILVPHAAEICW